MLLPGRVVVYIVPAAGSLVLQVIAAVVLSTAGMSANVRRATKAFFRSLHFSPIDI